MESNQSQLVTIVESSGLEPESANGLKLAFAPLFEQAEHWRQQVATIKVTDVSQVREMKLARESRLALREIRIKADKTRKALKEDSLRRGKAIDGCYNVLEFLITPLEKALLDQEQFAERKEAARKAAIKAEREAAMLPYSPDLAAFNFEEMAEATFAALLAQTKAAHEAKIEAARKAEEDRIAREKAEAAERERIRQENERLKREADEREKQMRAEREKAERERKAAEEAARKEREAIEAKAKAEREKAEAEARKEREAREKLEREKREADAREQARIAKEKEDARRAAAAPDREKLAAYAVQVVATVPTVSTDEGKAAVSEITAQAQKFAAWIESRIAKL